MQVIALAQEAAPLPDPIALHLVEERAEAHAQPPRGFAPVAASGPEGGFDRPALGGFDGLTQGGLTPGPPLKVITPWPPDLTAWFPLSTLWRGGHGVRTTWSRGQGVGTATRDE